MVGSRLRIQQSEKNEASQRHQFQHVEQQKHQDNESICQEGITVLSCLFVENEERKFKKAQELASEYSFSGHTRLV